MIRPSLAPARAGSLLLSWLCLPICCELVACATVPSGQYGVREIEWSGTESMSGEAIEACLATRELDEVTVRLGFESPSCGDPPFDSAAPSGDLWAWPWTEWPVYDPAILEVDRERILRWYRARGYYEASVLKIEAVSNGEPVKSPECKPDQDCELDVMIEVEEGMPVMVEEVRLEPADRFDEAITQAMMRYVQLRPDQRFDEATYEGDKRRLRRYLRNSAFAKVKVTGEVVIDRGRRSALVTYRIDTGPRCVFGEVVVREEQSIPSDLVIEAASIPKGAAYSENLVDDAQRAIFKLGVFSSVQIEERYPGDGNVVDLVVTVRRGRFVRPSAGVGLMSGTLQRTTSDEVTSVPQWDVHLRGVYEHRNFLGGLRRLRIEERPRLIMLDEFPRVPRDGPRLGNVLSVLFEQPSTFESRTVLLSENEWDLGPDPFYGYFRHDLATKIGVRRPFLKQRLEVELSLEHDLYEITSDASAPDTVSDYRLPFIEEQVRLDLRDDLRRPRWGFYAAVASQQAVRIAGYGDWNYVRVIPDVRGYMPLLWDVVLAARFSIGALFVLSSSEQLDPTSAALGPQTYRLRGGGANSNRGFFAGQLGDGIEGGKRRFEGSLEVRVPLGNDLGIVAFGDVGDVSQEPRFRFSHLNTSVGLGLRYYLIVGAARLDAAWRVPGLQRLGGGSDEADEVELGPAPSAVHLTLGEAF